VVKHSLVFSFLKATAEWVNGFLSTTQLPHSCTRSSWGHVMGWSCARKLASSPYFTTGESFDEGLVVNSLKKSIMCKPVNGKCLNISYKYVI